jgi:hypothetical protein
MAFALVELGLQPSEFLQLTPAQWPAITKAWEERERRINLRISRLIAGGFWANGADPAIIPEDHFMPQPPLTEEEMQRQLFESFCGIVAHLPQVHTKKAS